MRGGLHRHPSLEPCSESLAWSQPTGLNFPAEESLQLGASHNSHREKPPGLVIPPLHEGAIRYLRSNLRNSLIFTLTSDARDLDSGLYIVLAMSSPRNLSEACVFRLLYTDYLLTSPPVWQSRTTMQHSTCPAEEIHCPLGLPRNPK